MRMGVSLFVFFFNDTATTEIYTLSLHDALPILRGSTATRSAPGWRSRRHAICARSEEHTSELQSQSNLVCRLLLEKKTPNTVGAFRPSQKTVSARSSTVPVSS